MKRPSIKEKVPAYLRPFVAEQDPSLYTALDHAGWRYIMRVSKSYFAEHAHQKYLDGLEETGISTERIPLVDEVDRKLERFGWRACAIVGFIPPAVFMEFLSLGILPIACDMRTHEHLAYTPAPDIVHEAAGHAPILADQEYADYLYHYGEIARKVIFSSQDMDVYEAIRALSDIKEDPASTEATIAAAQQRLDLALAQVSFVSEATELSRMGWWTIEYGLVGGLESPKIYGAGLLSSIGESYHCFSPAVKKVPFTVDCVKTTYDITKPQPQLFVTPDFKTLSRALDAFAATLAFRQGGLSSLEKAKRCATVTTTVLDSGVQIGGVVDEIMACETGAGSACGPAFITSDGSTPTAAVAGGAPAYLRFRGPCQLACGDYELEGHGPAYHAQGFGTPLGRLKGATKALAEFSDEELRALGRRFQFASGVLVEGRLERIVRYEGRAVVLAFEDCRVTLGSRVLFEPAWGTFDLACGERVVSVFGGAPDRSKYLEATGGFAQKPAKPKSNRTPENAELCELYAEVRRVRESSVADEQRLARVADALERHYPDDWLLRLELLEFKKGATPWAATMRAQLGAIGRRSGEKRELIERGLKLI